MAVANALAVADVCEQCLLMVRDVPIWVITLSLGTTFVGAIALVSFQSRDVFSFS